MAPVREGDNPENTRPNIVLVLANLVDMRERLGHAVKRISARAALATKDIRLPKRCVIQQLIDDSQLGRQRQRHLG